MIFKWVRGNTTRKLAISTFDAAKTIYEPERAEIARELLRAMRDAHSAFERLPPLEFDDYLAQVTEAALKRRHLALKRGATSERHPEWNAAHSVEIWAGSRLGARRRLISNKSFDAIDNLAFNFIVETLGREEVAAALKD
jgi:hypothetical protein